MADFFFFFGGRIIVDVSRSHTINHMHNRFDSSDDQLVAEAATYTTRKGHKR